MNRLENIALCAYMNVKKELGTSKLYLVWIISFIFQYYTFSGMKIICRYLGSPTAPWVFPFYLTSPSMLIVYSGLAMLLFCDVPSMDGQAPFVLIRVGKRDWILGQILYVVILAFFYTLWNMLCSVLVLVPNIVLKNEWGSVFRTIASYPEIMWDSGATIGFAMDLETFEMFTPVAAMIISGILYWFGTIFLGMIILAFYVMTGKMLGIAVCGFLVALAYFSCSLGLLGYGSVIGQISPINWSSLLSGNGNEAWKWSILKYTILSLAFGVISVVMFCRKDVVFTSRGR